MKHRNALVALLLAQTVLVGLAWWPADPSASRSQPMIALASEAVERIRIVTPARDDGEESTEVILSREGESWKLDSAGGYPAETEKVTKLLADLLAFEVGDPVATHSSRHNYLKVGDKDFGKRVSLETADDRVEIVIGAAGNDRIYVRRSDRDAVYTARGITEWSIRGDDKGYYDLEVVQFDQLGLASLVVENEHGTLHFERAAEGEGWNLLELPAGASLDAEAAESFIASLNGLNIVRPVGEGIEPRFGLEGGVSVRWTLASSDQSSGDGYVIGAPDGEESFLKVDSSSHVVTVANARLDPIREAQLSDLLAPGALVQPE